MAYAYTYAYYMYIHLYMLTQHRCPLPHSNLCVSVHRHPGLSPQSFWAVGNSSMPVSVSGHFSPRPARLEGGVGGQGQARQGSGSRAGPASTPLFHLQMHFWPPAALGHRAGQAPPSYPPTPDCANPLGSPGAEAQSGISHWWPLRSLLDRAVLFHPPSEQN